MNDLQLRKKISQELKGSIPLEKIHTLFCESKTPPSALRLVENILDAETKNLDDETFFSAILELFLRIEQKKIPKKELEKEIKHWIELADQLGLWKLRYEIEDRFFEKLDPENFRLLFSLLEKKQAEYKTLLQEIEDILGFYLASNGISDFELICRKKNLYGIFQKIQNKNKNINHINDFFGFRIIVETEGECRKVLETLHHLWPHYEQHKKDYIKNPKKNGYQALHTSLKCLNKNLIEFQIRTRKMDFIAKYGSAHHAEYKKQSRA